MPTLGLLVCAALAALVLPSPLTAAPSVPLRPLGGGLWTVAVDGRTDAADDSTRWHFLVDTGSTHTVLAEAAARRAGLLVTPGRLLLTPAGLIEVGETRLPALAVGDRVRRDVLVLVADLTALGRDPRIDGILGMDVLDADRIVLDLVVGSLSLVDGAAARRPGGGIALPAREVGGRLVVEARVDGRLRSLVLDTGAAVTVLYEDAAGGAAFWLGTAGGVTSGLAARAELSVGRLHLGPVPAVRVRTRRPAAMGEGLLPGAVFARIDIDRAAGIVRLVPRR
jgi:predicted aspartyl protease